MVNIHKKLEKNMKHFYNLFLGITTPQMLRKELLNPIKVQHFDSLYETSFLKAL